MPETSDDARVTDPLALRALAHPVRWKLIDVLASEGTVTATRCAQVLGESTATCSYHLGILAKYGYITRVAGAQWREKPWKLARGDLGISASGDDQEQAAASRAAAAAFVDHEMARLKESLRASAGEPAEWQGTHKIMAATAKLTAAEARQAITEIGQVLARYGERPSASGQPGTAREVRLFAAISPVPAGPAPGNPAPAGPPDD